MSQGDPHQVTPRSRSAQLRAERGESWEELEELVVKVERGGLKNASAEELSRLPHLYRSALSSLSVARSISLDRNLERYLDSLCARAYLCVYTSRQQPLEGLRAYINYGFPCAVYAMRAHLGIATMVMMLGALVAAQLVMDDPKAFHTFVEASYAQGRGPDSTTEELRAVLFAGEEFSADRLGEFAGFLMTHNARIGMMCFGLGFALGLPTLYLLFQNGAVLGAFAGLYAGRGLTMELFSWLLPHGVTEILAVLLCGAAGFWVAEAVLLPGRETRVQSLARRGREAGRVVIGAVAMFMVAGLIEGIFRQQVQSIPARYAVASMTAIYWVIYLGVWPWWVVRSGSRVGGER